MSSNRHPGTGRRRIDDSPWRITRLYVILSLFWIVVSFAFLSRLRLSGVATAWIELFKGTFWVLASAAILHVLVFRHIRRIRKSEQELRERLSAGEELGQFGTEEWIPSRGERLWSEGMCRLWGVDPGGGVPSQDWMLDHVNPEDAPQFRKWLGDVHDGAPSGPLEVRIRRADGEERLLRYVTRFEEQTSTPPRAISTAQDVTDLALASRDARRSEAMLRAVLESSAEGLIVVHAGTREVLVWNHRYPDLLGVPEALLEAGDSREVRRDLLRRVRSADRVDAWMEELYRTPEAACMDLIEMTDGRVIERTTAPVYLEGAPTARIWGYRDVTARIRSEEELRRREHHLKVSQEIAKLGSFEWDPERNEIHWSDELFRIYGYEPFPGPVPREFARERRHPEDRDRLGEAVDQAIQTGHAEPVTYRIVRPDGEVRSLRATGEVVEHEPGKKVLFGIVQDITERIAIERESASLAHEVELLLESSGAGLIALDREGRCRLVNRTAREILGFREDELLGASIYDLVQDLPREPDEGAEGPMGGAAGTRMYDRNFRRRDGKLIPCDVTITPIEQDGTDLVRAVSFVDVTERNLLEAQLERAERLSSLGRLAASIAHEMNNVLMGILPFAEIVSRKGEGRIAAAGDQIRQSVQRGRSVTQEILRFTRPSPPEKKRFAADEWIRGLAPELQEIVSARAEWSLEVGAESLWIEADPSQLEQVVSNLVMNARDAVAERGGNVTVSMARAARGASFPFGDLSSDEHDWVHLTVRDTGDGMDAETLRHVFEPFFTTKRGGTGLGLPIAQKMVSSNDGILFIESTPRVGTAFHVFLPGVAVGVNEDPVGTPGRAELPRSILLVEDDETVATGLIAGLEIEGVDVTLVGTGGAAIERLVERPGAMILDVGLPDMDGTEVCKFALQRWPDLPVVFSTGHGDASRLGHFLDRPNVGFLMKPYTFEDLHDAIVAVTKGRRSA